VSLNAVYFKGISTTKFLKNETKEEIFFNRRVNEVKKEIMKRNGKFNYIEIESLNSKLLELPYSGDDLSLYIVFPNEKQVFTSATDLSEIDGKKRFKSF
jgi:serpin B